MIAKFKTFLGTTCRMDVEKCDLWASIVEEKLPQVLSRYDPAFTTIEEKDKEYFIRMRQKLAAQSDFIKNCPDSSLILWALNLIIEFLEDERRKAGLGKTTRKPGKLVVGNGTVRAPVSQPKPVKVLNEGEITEMHISRHERNPAVRAACVEYFRGRHGGAVLCEACGLSFGERYGEIGEGYIEVHHLSPISQTEGGHAVDPKTDLVPLCANCHAMIHRLMAAMKKTSGADLEGPAALEKLRDVIKEHRQHV